MNSISTPPTPPTPSPAARPRGTRRRIVWRWSRRSLVAGVAVLAALIVAILSIDLGRIDIGGYSLRERAEQFASEYLERPMHIGEIRAHLTPGTFELTDVRIDGLTPTDRPFLTAKRIFVEMNWGALFRDQIIFQVTMDDWEVVIERWSGGRHNIPRFVRKKAEEGPKRYTTTATFVNANRGQFTYIDHTTPWSVICRNLDVNVVRNTALSAYTGTFAFRNGTVQIQNYQPMWANMKTSFTFDGPVIKVTQGDLETDGARTALTGQVSFNRWPEQFYNVNSRINFARMREIFFADATWRAAGEGRFNGVFKIDSGGHNLAGQFTSRETTVADMRFENLRGALEWLPRKFEVTHADADFYGGRMTLAYLLAPLGTPERARASFTGNYEGVDLFAVTQLFDWTSVEPEGRMRGRFALSWPNGEFGTGRSGEGETVVTPPEGAPIASPAVPASEAAPPARAPFDPRRPLGRFPVAAHAVYRFEPGGIAFEPSWIATPSTHVAFSGRTADVQSKLEFRTASHNWQESSRLLAAILSEFGRSPVQPIDVGGRGTFEGVMTGRLGAPRIEGKFAGQSIFAWDVVWGPATGDLVIENRYLDLTNGRIGDPAGAHILADGRFSLGFPRKDAGEEINARIRARGWPLADILDAFNQEDWPLQGVIASADLQLSGHYERLVGAGQLRIDQGTAWDEAFETATARLDFIGSGVRVTSIQMAKGAGTITGAAEVGWDGTYSFEAIGERIDVGSLDNFKLERAPLTGLLQFKATGAGTFDAPVYRFEGFVADLFAGDEGIGQVRGRLVVRNNVLTIEQLTAASTRLQVDGLGTIALDDARTADLQLSFLQSSLDPYIKFFAPRVSPYTRAIVSGNVSVRGPLEEPERLRVVANVHDAALTLLDYDLRNQGEIVLTYQNQVFKISSPNPPSIPERLVLVGQDTLLELSGGADGANRRVDIEANGRASLAILHLFFPELRADGSAVLNARIQGPLDDFSMSGEARISDGRLKLHALPHSLTDISGPIRFDASGVRVDGLQARLGEGDVTFSGNITMRGDRLDEFNLMAVGQSMNLRYPEGVHSTVNANLALIGPIKSPRLTGQVEVLRAVYRTRIEGNNLLALAGGGAEVEPGGLTAPPAVAQSGIPLTLDIDISTPAPVEFIRTSAGDTIEGRADLRLTGTLDRPALLGRIDIDRGEWVFQGNRYFIRRGSIEWLNPNRINEPVFDVEVETRPRSLGQTYNVNLRASGTFNRLSFTAESDPWLPEVDIVALLFGVMPNTGALEVSRLQTPQRGQERLLQSAGVILLASPITSAVGSVFERTPLHTVQITPTTLGGDDSTLQQRAVRARITVGQRISERVYLTYSRTLSSNEAELIVLEYEQSDHMSWVLSRNEDRSFALDFRIRHVF